MKAPKFDWSHLDIQIVLQDQLAAYTCARVVLYAQAFSLLATAAKTNEWKVDMAEVARVLRGGSVIRCALLKRWASEQCVRRRVQDVFAAQPALENLLLSEAFSKELSAKQSAWRRVCTLSVVAGITASTHMAALAYMDSYRCGRSPSALIQCLRNATMGEGFERLDKEKGMLFSCRWNK